MTQWKPGQSGNYRVRHSARDSTDHRYNKLASLSAGGQEKDRVLVPQNWKPKN
jgi:hypothetical protein